MTKNITMYPTGVSQPNRNKSSGLQGKCFKAVRRNGTTYTIGCRDQKDPKYHHEWSNAEEILKGNHIQCGRPSTKMCSHATYYGIAGYRNTCPIAGVSGTYTQPATLRLFFDLSKKNISSTAKIEKVIITFEHRCVGVNVANGKTSTSWGPNFSGFNVYPSKKALTVKLGSQTKTSNENPPLSSNYSSAGTFTFTNVTYNDLKKNGLDIIYGNNLETNPGNIYLRKLKATIYYEDGEPYISGTQNNKSLLISDVNTCRSEIKFTIEAGYKQGSKKVSISDAPKNLREDIRISVPDSNITYSYKDSSSNKRERVFTITDKTNKTGEKIVKFYIKGTKKEISFKYNAVKNPKPSINIPSEIVHNTIDNSVTSIVAKNGCANIIRVYDKKISGTPIYTFTNLTSSNKENIIPTSQINAFYKVLAQLPCGTHNLYFKRDNEDNKDAILKKIKITAPKYNFKITEVEDTKSLNSYETIQNKEENKTLKITYEKTKELINPPQFIIENPTHGKVENGNPTKELIDDLIWGTNNNPINKNGDSINFTVGTYYSGEYIIKIKDRDSNCPGNTFSFKVNITPYHKQYYDEIFVLGEDSTSFDYDYLVALEGDSITEPIYVNTIELGASYKDIKICTIKENITGLSNINSIKFNIKNTSQKDIDNLLLEFNVLRKDEDDNFYVTSNEWLESDGIFYNFKENFDLLNKDYEDIISIKNLTQDEDNIDEEDVCLYVKKIKAQEDITVYIPYGCGIEKEVYLQVLLFGQPIVLYEQGNCSDVTKVFDKILVKVYDSILTNMEIKGESDLFETEENPICPKECFKTKMEYSIKNIDSNNLDNKVKTVIENDPRLVPYKIEYKGKEYSIEEKISSLDKYIKFSETEITHNFTFYTDEYGLNTYITGTAKVIGPQQNNFVSIKILSNETDNSYINEIFYIENDEEEIYQLYQEISGEIRPIQNLFVKLIETPEIYSFILYDDDEGNTPHMNGLIELIDSSYNNFIPIKILSNNLEEDINKIYYIEDIAEPGENIYQLYELTSYNDIKYNTLVYNSGDAKRSSIISGAKIDVYTQFENYEETHLHQYTDYQGDATFFVTIPKTIGKTFTTNDLLKHMCIKFNGDRYYNGNIYSTKGSKYNVNVINGNGSIQIPPLPAGEYYITITKNNLNILDKKILRVNQQITLSPVEEDYSSSNAYLSFTNPEPEQNPIINITTLEDGEYIIILNDYSYKIDEKRYNINIENKTGVLEIPNLPAGDYYISLTKDDEILDKKILRIQTKNSLPLIEEDYSSSNVSLSFNTPTSEENPIINVEALEDGEYIVIVDDYLYSNNIVQSIDFSSEKNQTYFEVFENEIEYNAGQTVPIKIKLLGEIKYIQNELVFYPEIRNSGDKDSLIVHYQICNLDKNMGKLTTKFKTDDYKLIPNEISKKIYCGIDTTLNLYTKLSKVIVENTTLNRLHISLENKERDNKEIEVVFEEKEDIEKYDMVNYEVDVGTITLNDNKIIWKIDYIDEDSIVRGYIDFKAKEIGFSKIEGSVSDFIDKKDPKPNFGEDSYKCPCRKVITNVKY